MKIKVLDKKSGWILGKVSLLDYIESRSTANFNYEIQRGIVSNPFLDTILNAVVDSKPLPPISLVSKDVCLESEIIDVTKFNILDGLQRTFRLWIYYQLSTLAVNKKNDDYRVITKEFRNSCENYTMAVSPRQVRKLFKRDSNINVWNLKDKYSNFDLYLYVWTNLTVDQEIKQMLILNAGQKQMNINHQFELMYMRLFEEKKFDNNNIKIHRSKDGKISSRKIGNYNLSTVIIGVQSLMNMKPMRLSREMLYKDTDLSSNISLSSVEDVFTVNFIQKFLSLLLELDEKISVDQDSSDWFFKDTTISGIMAGMGSHLKTLNSNPSEILIGLKSCIDCIHNVEEFSLDQYKVAYNELSSVKVNIGMVVRKAIMYYTEALLDSTNISWKDAFNMSL